jgi:hypothetical protein
MVSHLQSFYLFWDPGLLRFRPGTEAAVVRIYSFITEQVRLKQSLKRYRYGSALVFVSGSSILP